MTTGQSSKRNCARSKNLVLSHVQYHPSIQNALIQDRKLQTFTETQRRTSEETHNVKPKSGKSSAQNAVVPRVRYHPSISQDGGRTAVKPAQMDKSKRTEEGKDALGPGGGARVEDESSADARTKKKSKGAKKTAKNTRSGGGECETGPKDEPKTVTSARSDGRDAGAAAGDSAGAAAGAAAGDSAGAAAQQRARKKSKQFKNSNQNSINNKESAGSRGAEGLDPVLLEPRPGLLLDLGLVDRVEVQTRGQRTNPDWFRFRQNRITASVAHSIAHCGFVNGKRTTPPASYVKAVLGESRRVETRAMTWGIEHEREAVLKYQEQQSAALGRRLLVQDCGLFIDPARPWLAASPDGIVTDAQTGQWLRCLEVKCPHKHRASSVQQAAKEDPRFCLETSGQQGAQQFSLKRTHPYFTQVQCQLAVTGLKLSDFAVFTLRELVVVQVPFDPDFWDETVSKLERFYSEAVIPALREKNPAWHPED